MQTTSSWGCVRHKKMQNIPPRFPKWWISHWETIKSHVKQTMVIPYEKATRESPNGFAMLFIIEASTARRWFQR